MSKIIIRDIKVNIDYDKTKLINSAPNILNINQEDIITCKIKKISLDARKKLDIHYKATLEVQVTPAKLEKLVLPSNASIVEDKPQEEIVFGQKTIKNNPVIIGSGPCGMLAAAILAKNGYNPIILERGKDAKSRASDVANFWKTGTLDSQSNAVFGEGGAGTFSDGKLTSRSKDPKSNQVLQFFVDMGAPEEILYLAKPHVGTNNLQVIVQNIRQYIEKNGGKYYFNTQAVDFDFDTNNNVNLIKTNNLDLPEISTNCCIIAIGHSARDTYQTLFDKKFDMISKPFAVGVRIEHTQKLINTAQYGLTGSAKLGAADYALTANANNRGVFSFCMCPGGSVIGCSSEENMIVTNGMSNYARNNTNSNSAIVVSVSPDDFENSEKNPLSGIEFQRDIEKKAFIAGGSNYFAPAQKVSDFIKKQKTKEFGVVKPSYTPGVTPANLWDVLPDFVCKSIALALPRFGNSIKGFDSGDAILTGVETRTSAPVRIVRGENFQATNHVGVFPAGEGSGYAGGIMSAAIDGVRCANALMQEFAPKTKKNNKAI